MMKPTSTLPGVIAVVAMHDYGPSGGEGSANCPHCGARGRYVIEFICEDGSRRGAMRGCFQLFPKVRGHEPVLKLVQEAFDRLNTAKAEGRKAASWWIDMAAAADAFGREHYADRPAVEAALFAFRTAVYSAENRRRTWLNKNGYGRKR